MRLPTRWIALALLPALLAMASGSEPGCNTPIPAAHHGSAQHGTPTPDGTPHPCPAASLTLCATTGGCLTMGLTPTAPATIVLSGETREPATTVLTPLFPRDITPESPPPRA
jgi:hypothetical protein